VTETDEMQRDHDGGNKQTADEMGSSPELEGENIAADSNVHQYLREAEDVHDSG